MDPRIAWLQPEQRGPANNLWMQIWETTQGLGYLHVNSNYTAAPPATPSLKANINAAAATPGDALITGRHGTVTSSSSISSGREVGSQARMSHPMKDGDILKQRDFIPLESNNNQNNRASGRAGVVGGAGQPGTGGVALGAGHTNKRKRDNKASTYGFNSSLLHADGPEVSPPVSTAYTGTPWKDRNYSEGIIG